MKPKIGGTFVLICAVMALPFVLLGFAFAAFAQTPSFLRASLITGLFIFTVYLVLTQASIMETAFWADMDQEGGIE